jgi:hypothetical protein
LRLRWWQQIKEPIMSTQPHQPTRKVEKNVTDRDFQVGSEGYPDIPTDEPGLVGGPATSSEPGASAAPLEAFKQHEQALTDPLPGEAVDGGESVLSGRPRETGGDRPPKKIPKTEGS